MEGRSEFPELSDERAGLREEAARWNRCEVEGCLGKAADGGRCFVHMKTSVALRSARLGAVDISGCDVPEWWWREFTNALGVGDYFRLVAEYARFGSDSVFGSPKFRQGTSFAHTHFGDRVQFDGTKFVDSVDFHDARFGEVASFERASFDQADFRHTRFGDGASFDGATVAGRGRFDDAALGDSMGFRGTRFDGHCSFNKAKFGRDAGFIEARLDGGVSFIGTSFGEAAAFEGARFGDGSRLIDASFAPKASFAGAQFGDVSWGVVFFSGPVRFQRIVAEKRFEVTWVQPVPGGEPPQVSFDWARFDGAFVLRGQGEVSLKGVDVRAASIVAPAYSQITQLRHRHTRLDESLPLRVASLAGSHVTELTLEDVSLDGCRFAGAVGLSSLSLEGSITFQRTPRWRSTQRAVLAEERVREEVGLSYETLEGIYRSLRKAKEDSGDYPGGSDFHYGHMLMRTRRAKGAERAILEPFRLVGGYGVRAWRAFVAFIVVVLAFALILQGSGGLTCPEVGPGETVSCATDLPAAIEVSVQSATSIGHDLDSSQLSTGGFYLMLSLRILGPALLAMGFLALRARVRR